MAGQFTPIGPVGKANRSVAIIRLFSGNTEMATYINDFSTGGVQSSLNPAKENLKPTLRMG